MRRKYSISFAAAGLACWASAQAADLPVYKAAPAAVSAIEYGNVYIGADVTSHDSIAGYMGVLYAPFGMHQSGLRVSAFGLAGRYEYDSDGIQHKGNFVSFDLLAGYSYVFATGAITLQAGLNYQDHKVRPFDPTNPVQGAEAGFKVQGDVWANPTPLTLVYGLASYATTFNTYYALGRVGYDVTTGRGIFFGPEVGGLGNDRTDQIRVGLFVSGIMIGAAKVTVSGGWMNERDEGDGAYGMATLDFSF